MKIVLKGGPGSGHHGHGGRPGQVGGSSAGTGASGRTGPSLHVPSLTSDIEFAASDKLSKWANSHNVAFDWSGAGHGMWKRPFLSAHLPKHEARIFVTDSGKYRVRLHTDGGDETSFVYSRPGDAIRAGNDFVAKFKS
jgi:hypothetical protein